jgi:hypothetical protein
MKKLPLLLIMLLPMAGCVTFDQTPFPDVHIPSAPKGTDITLQIAGFSASRTTFLPTYGYTTVVGPAPACRGRRAWGPRTYTTVSYQAQLSDTPIFRDRATDAFERAGFLTRAPQPRYRVEVTFDGPFATGADHVEAAAWSLLSLLTADRGIQTWRAALRLHDNATGRLVHARDYTQTYHATAWGPVPLFSPAAAGTTDEWAMTVFCLSALTDRAVADAAAFLAGTAPGAVPPTARTRENGN